MQVKMNAKLAIRIAILMVGMVGAFVATSVQNVPVADGGPILLCPPGTPENVCKTTLPPPTL
jgi:hypothetical protein